MQGVTIGTTCSAYGDQCRFDFSSFMDSLSFLTADVGRYQLINEKITIKGDGRWGVDRGERVHFFDSIGGYRGSDKANTEGNAYKSYILTSNYPINDPIQAWVMRWSVRGIPSPSINYQQLMINQQYYEQYGPYEKIYPPKAGDSTNYGSFSGEYYCSKKEFFLQRRPYIGPNGFSAPFNFSGFLYARFPYGIPLYYELDWNSKAIKENRAAKITLYASTSSHGKRTVSTINVTQQKGTVALSPSGYILNDGWITFSAEINDGVFSSGEIQLGKFLYIEPMPQQCGIDCPESLGWYRGQCQITKASCYYKDWD
ncbi:hypothetical protein O59_000270 [Cellvibrio sp. BR]|nr:hypothetical protein O59_000270 [Cellvibrio sp. BR]